MKYLEVTFTTHPCNETVNDVVSALAGEIGSIKRNDYELPPARHYCDIYH